MVGVYIRLEPIGCGDASSSWLRRCIQPCASALLRFGPRYRVVVQSVCYWLGVFDSKLKCSALLGLGNVWYSFDSSIGWHSTASAFVVVRFHAINPGCPVQPLSVVRSAISSASSCVVRFGVLGGGDQMSKKLKADVCVCRRMV